MLFAPSAHGEHLRQDGIAESMSSTVVANECFAQLCVLVGALSQARSDNHAQSRSRSPLQIRSAGWALLCSIGGCGVVFCRSCTHLGRTSKVCDIDQIFPAAARSHTLVVVICPIAMEPRILPLLAVKCATTIGSGCGRLILSPPSCLPLSTALLLGTQDTISTARCRAHVHGLTLQAVAQIGIALRGFADGLFRPMSSLLR